MGVVTKRRLVETVLGVVTRRLVETVMGGILDFRLIRDDIFEDAVVDVIEAIFKAVTGGDSVVFCSTGTEVLRKLVVTVDVVEFI